MTEISKPANPTQSLQGKKSEIDDVQLQVVNDVFEQKKQYFIIALTGKVGSGCSETAQRLLKPVDELLPSYPQPGLDGMKTNEEREIRMIRRFYHDNAPDFKIIRVREIITSFLLQDCSAWNRVKVYYHETILNEKEPSSDNSTLWDSCVTYANQNSSSQTISEKLACCFNIIKNWPANGQDISKYLPELQCFITEWLPAFSQQLHEKLGNGFTDLYQTFGSELRFFGTLNPDEQKSQVDLWYLETDTKATKQTHPMYTIAARINAFIKILRRSSDGPQKKKPIPVVIDSIKNIYESNYLKERYSAFYLVAISCDEDERIHRLMHHRTKRYTTEIIERIDLNERPSQACKKIRPFIQTLIDIANRSDIKLGDGIKNYLQKGVLQFDNCAFNYLDNPEGWMLCNNLEKILVALTNNGEDSDENESVLSLFKDKGINLSMLHYYSHTIKDPLRIFLYITGLYPFFLQDVESCIQSADIFIADTERNGYKPHLNYQLIRYISLMMHPGLVLPTPVERCMQIAYAAKANSGCISRQVGAVTTDQNYNILSLGWNDVPCGQTSCIHRNLIDLWSQLDKPAFSDYEWDPTDEVHTFLRRTYSFEVNGDNSIKKRLNGLPGSFCFKDIQAQITGEKNPMNARAMHGEEKALLLCDQQRVHGGYLFTTSSPCEMCAKNAKEHHISRIYYIEPYPGISQKHCCNSGTLDNRAEFVLFEGAIGRAYTQLYSSTIPYKDELKLRGFPNHFRITHRQSTLQSKSVTTSLAQQPHELIDDDTEQRRIERNDDISE